MYKQILALEGPAGSGKTVQTGRIVMDGGNYHLLSRPAETTGARQYNNESLPIKADFERVHEALYSPQPNFISDRFWISSAIYQPMKNKVSSYADPRYYPSHVLVRGDVETLGLWLTGLIKGGSNRDFTLKTIDRVFMKFYVILPSMQILKKNQETDSRDFPFDAGVELAYYENYCRNFTPWDNGFVRIDLQAFRVYHPRDYDNLLVRAKMDLNNLKN